MDASELQLTHTGLWVIRRDHVVVPAIVDQYEEEHRRHALVFHWLVTDGPGTKVNRSGAVGHLG